MGNSIHTAASNKVSIDATNHDGTQMMASIHNIDAAILSSSSDTYANHHHHHHQNHHNMASSNQKHVASSSSSSAASTSSSTSGTRIPNNTNSTTTITISSLQYPQRLKILSHIAQYLPNHDLVPLWGLNWGFKRIENVIWRGRYEGEMECWRRGRGAAAAAGTNSRIAAVSSSSNNNGASASATAAATTSTTSQHHFLSDSLPRNHKFLRDYKLEYISYCHVKQKLEALLVSSSSLSSSSSWQQQQQHSDNNRISDCVVNSARKESSGSTTGAGIGGSHMGAASTTTITSTNSNNNTAITGMMRLLEGGNKILVADEAFSLPCFETEGSVNQTTTASTTGAAESSQTNDQQPTVTTNQDAHDYSLNHSIAAASSPTAAAKHTIQTQQPLQSSNNNSTTDDISNDYDSWLSGPLSPKSPAVQQMSENSPSMDLASPQAEKVTPHSSESSPVTEVSLSLDVHRLISASSPPREYISQFVQLTLKRVVQNHTANQDAGHLSMDTNTTQHSTVDTNNHSNIHSSSSSSNRFTLELPLDPPSDAETPTNSDVDTDDDNDDTDWRNSSFSATSENLTPQRSRSAARPPPLRTTRSTVSVDSQNMESSSSIQQGESSADTPTTTATELSQKLPVFSSYQLHTVALLLSNASMLKESYLCQDTLSTLQLAKRLRPMNRSELPKSPSISKLLPDLLLSNNVSIEGTKCKIVFIRPPDFSLSPVLSSFRVANSNASPASTTTIKISGGEMESKIISALIIGPFLLYYDEQTQLVIPKKLIGEALQTSSRFLSIAEIFNLSIFDIRSIIAETVARFNRSKKSKWNCQSFVDSLLSELGLNSLNQCGVGFFNTIKTLRRHGIAPIAYCIEHINNFSTCTLFKNHDQLDRFVNHLLKEEPTFPQQNWFDFLLLRNFDCVLRDEESRSVSNSGCPFLCPMLDRLL